MAKKLAYSKYNKNALKGDVYHYIDCDGFVLGDKGNGGKGDCIGSNYRAYMAHRDPKLAEAVANLWDYSNSWDTRDNSIVGIRHPDLWDDESKMSRDHYINTLALLKEALRDGADKEVPGIISDKFSLITGTKHSDIENIMRFPISLKLWTKALRGSKVSEWLFYALEILTAVFYYIPITKLGNLIAGFSTKEVDQDEWIDYEPKYIQNQESWKGTVSKFIYPAFARGFLMTQVYALDDNFPAMRNALLRVHRPLVGSTNYVQKLQLGMKVPEDKVEWYQPMMGGRWSGWLNNRNDRWIRKLNMIGKDTDG